MPPNIVLFVADDIPRNMLGAYGARSDLSPNLDALAREGVVFERAPYAPSMLRGMSSATKRTMLGGIGLSWHSF